MLYIACDHAAFDLKNRIFNLIKELGFEVSDLVPANDPKDDYPDQAKLLADALKTNPDDRGIALCGTSQGICMAMNRFGWVRAGLVDTAQITKQIRLHNDANVICIPGPYSGKEFTDEELKAILQAFLTTEADPDQRHTRRVEKLNNL